MESHDPYEGRVTHSKLSEIRRLLKYADAPGWISFGGGFPDEVTFFMRDKLEKTVSELKITGKISKAMQYSASQGIKDLKEALAGSYLPGMGITLEQGEDILISSGAQQVLSGFGKMFSGEKMILTETPTYVGALPAFRQRGAKTHGVKTGRDGMDPEDLERCIREKGCENINFIYIIPNFQNPTGIQTSQEKRRKLLDIAWKYDIPILEDDPYPLMHFPGKSVPRTIKSMEQERLRELRNKGEIRKPLVSYSGTSSKTFGGGFRVGWMLGASELVSTQAALIGTECLHTCTMTQYLIADYLKKNGYEGLVKDTEAGRERYYKKMKQMSMGLREVLGEEIEFMEPDGGLFLWVRVRGVNTKDMLDFITGRAEAGESGLDHCKIIYVPGCAFSPDESQNLDEYMRITYANSNFEEIGEGVKRLKNLLKLYRSR